ncbi:MAG: Gfo/Idh/MocA family oxidoreductase [Clostridiales bacterium]|jgi:predicted dehydrogenase|nr:Gfo/Idh/MocA family oxidoreductase [Clostridiales bacterium]
MAKYKVAVIGNGMIANAAHIPAWRDITDIAEIVAVADDRGGIAQETAERYGIPQHYKDYNELLAKEQPDIVSVCTPNVYHKAAAIASLKAGAHVLCEKPLSVSEAGAAEMYDAAEKAGKILYANQTMRFMEPMIAAKAFFDAGYVGKPYYIEASAVRRRGIPKWGFFHMKEHNAWGPGFDIGVHVLDALLWIVGAPKVKSVVGKAYTAFGDKDEGLKESLAESGAPIGVFTPRPYSYKEFNVEDFITGFVRLEGGLTLSLKASWAINAPEGGAATFISGTKGGLSLFPELELISNMAGYQTSAKAKVPTTNNIPFSGHFGATKQMIAAIEGREEMLVKKSEVLNVLRILDALYASSESEHEVVFERSMQE